MDLNSVPKVKKVFRIAKKKFTFAIGFTNIHLFTKKVFNKMADEKQLSAFSLFFQEKKAQTIKYLMNTFGGLNYQDCEDIYQEASCVLLQKKRDGELDNLKSSLYTYFVSVCRFKSFEYFRKNQKNIELVDDFCNAGFDMKKIDFVISLDDNSDFEDKKEEAVRQIVKNLPDPCDKVLWGYFRDNFSVTTLAAMYDKTESNIKVTKLRCCEKFKNRFKEVFNQLINRQL